LVCPTPLVLKFLDGVEALLLPPRVEFTLRSAPPPEL